ncbi:ABC transporter ATP-binding protein [Desulfovibrio aminophilus]|nr:ABC transporter ATP-binding protein [Desulfovibrio aminophilus]MCM0756232.1 ABC transporter ATP-binding protein [Desulfovibrio aminophilus]
MNSEPLYLLSGVGKEYDGPTERLRVLDKIDLRIEAGESVAIIGASGSGKTTLLHIMGTLDAPTHGEVRFAGQSLRGLSIQKRSVLRNRDIGFVFQFHHLLAEFSTLENVAMPGLIGGLGREASLRLAREALEQVGLEHRLEHRVTTLSGGERQRAAIARAILLKPKVVLADEPTGNLDEKTGQAVGDLLVSLNRNLGMTFVIVTHNVELASVMGRRLELRSGELYAH